MPDRYRERLFYHHNPNVTLMRTTPEENAIMGRWIGEKLNACPGLVCLLLPEKGLSALDVEGGAFWAPDADAALFAALRDTILAHQTPRLALKLSDRKDGDVFVMDVRVSVS